MLSDNFDMPMLNLFLKKIYYLNIFLNKKILNCNHYYTLKQPFILHFHEHQPFIIKEFLLFSKIQETDLGLLKK